MPPSRWLAALGVAALLAAFVAVTLRPVPITISRQATHSCTTPDREASIQRFSRILQFQTIASIQAHRHVRDESEVLRLQEFLANSYKAAYAHLDQQKVLDLSLLLKWPGQNQGLDPAIFISHTDVVPVGDDSAWKHGPFSGAVADGYVWGRGAQDVKVTIMQMLEAVSLLISEGFEPERTAYLAFGHDEETKGTGALATAELLASQGVKPVVILDEGGALLTDGIKGVTDIPTAVVAVAEKGYLSLELAIRGEGGHSSMPEYGQPNVVSLAAGFLRVFHKHPPPIKVVDPVPGTFRALAFGMHVPLLRWLLSRAHIWPWRPLLGLILSRSKSAEIAALVRTTAAVVDIRTTPAGDNVLPDTIYISFNFRTLPGEDLSWPEAYLRRLARRAGVPAEALSIRLTAVDNASSVTEASGPYFQAIHIALQETLAPTKGLLVAPNLLNGKTDSAHYLQVFPGTPVLRFTPVPTNMSAGDLKGIHGVNERCSINGFLAGICFYKQAMRRLLS